MNTAVYLQINFIIVVVVLNIMFNTIQMARKTSATRVKAGVRGFIVLLPVMGLTWIFGIVAFDSNMVVFHYLFSILNSLQGFFIFILHCVMNEKIRQAVKKLSPQCIRPTVSETKTTGASNGQN
ncbi:adhesion G-protein coupled receptor D1-like isoform X2 [Ruditapes philippinarum]|uniref:adhesion G-protein coupled receptor D1-like isoform X2 n=1 Tax=Ruditapes philippinarum TaxID=129788 RepID=UPI00295ADED2|nr:adhesion G-protein coupled receptor D1-like isoform X2 [Ruditapes philippinarum]